MVQGCPSTVSIKKKESLALARKVRLENLKIPKVPPTHSANDTEYLDAHGESSGDKIECTGWTGGVAQYISSGEDPNCRDNQEVGTSHVALDRCI